MGNSGWCQLFNTMCDLGRNNLDSRVDSHSNMISYQLQATSSHSSFTRNRVSSTSRKKAPQHNEQTDSEQHTRLTPDSRLSLVFIPIAGDRQEETSRRLVRSQAIKYSHAAKRHTLTTKFQTEKDATRTKLLWVVSLPKNTFSEISRLPKPNESLLKVAREERTRNKHLDCGHVVEQRISSDQSLVSVAPSISLGLGMASKMASPYTCFGGMRSDPFLTYPLPTSQVEMAIIDYCTYYNWLELYVEDLTEVYRHNRYHSGTRSC